MGYHAVNEGSSMKVYSQSSCPASSIIGEIYNTECLTIIGVTTGYLNVNEIRFLNPSGQYVHGFIDKKTFGNLAYYGVSTSITGISSCYRFKLRRSLSVVTPSGSSHTTLYSNDYVYTQSATAGQTNPANMHIVAYKKNGTLTTYNGFVKLVYSGGSMIHSSFCLMKA